MILKINLRQINYYRPNGSVGVYLNIKQLKDYISEKFKIYYHKKFLYILKSFKKILGNIVSLIKFYLVINIGLNQSLF